MRCTECAACGYSLESFPKDVRHFVRSDEYRATAHANAPAGVRDAMAASLLAKRIRQPERAFRYALTASWAADDEVARRAKTGEPQDPALGEGARRLAVRLWVDQCGDVLRSPIARTHETAQVSLTGEPLLDNQALVDLLRRLGDWPAATKALEVAQVALSGTVAEWAEVGWPDTDDQRELLSGCQSLLDVEARLIQSRDARPAGARVCIPPWWADS
jgi:hypothetical protein